MVKYKILIDGVDYTSSCSLPFKEQYVLDSALDNGVLTLFMTQRKEIFKPFTPITITKDNDTYTMLVASDKVTEIVGTGKYNHDLVLIEETKLLEKKVVDTNTTTQPLVHDYIGTASDVYYNISRSGNILSSNFVVLSYRSVIRKNSVYTIISPEKLKNRVVATDQTLLEYYQNLGAWINLTNPSGQTTTTYISGQASGSWDREIIDYSFNELGTYTVEYNYSGANLTKLTYELQVIKQEEADRNRYKTITDVVNRLLSITETLRANETPALVFNQEQADFYNQAKETWLLNDSIDVTTNLDVNIEFISNNTTYSNISTHSANLYYDNISMYFAVGDGWRDNAYKTIIFQQRPTGDLLTWLQANGTKQSEELLYPAPEFSMTKSTLRECLDQIGGYIHAIVRLVGNEIYFDKLGGTTQAELDANYIGHYETLDAEQYASQLDSIVSNITNIDDKDTGTISEPFPVAYKTVRAEQIRINDTDAIIETDYPIEKIEKLYCGYITANGNTVIVGDITPYVYEKAEYDLLSSNSGTYPLSKGYAITYTQGQPNITGLMFKLPNAFGNIFENQAILNIISQKLGYNVQSIFSVQNITELMFRIIYYPSTTARVKQSRTDINNYSMELTGIYNQGANKVDSRAYGENLKGAIARLGNIEKFITYDLSSPDDLQNVGDYVIIDNEDYYIATLSVENQIDHTKVTVGLSKDFNALSKYIGIKNNIRLYEVSEKQSVERYVCYDDYCVIGNAITSDNKQLITPKGVEKFTAQFGSTGDIPISVARLKGTDIDNNPLTEVDLPIFTLGFGNSIWLGCKFKDNYSAGNKSIDPPTLNSGYYRLNQFVKYTDDFGEVETLSVKLYNSQVITGSKANAIALGNSLPEATETLLDNDLCFSTDQSNWGRIDDDIVIKKDSREQINFSYQMHFVTNDNIIIGSQLAQGNIFVNGKGNNVKFYILPNRINKFTKNVDLTNATNVAHNGFYYDYTSITWRNITATVNGKSWVLIDSTNGKLLFGKNIDIASGDTIVMPKMTFTHKII